MIGPPPSDVPNQISADPKVRRQQMENLARSRVERSEARGMAKEAFKMSVTALNQIKGVIGTALQVYPVAGLAWAGVSLILEVSFAMLFALWLQALKDVYRDWW